MCAKAAGAAQVIALEMSGARKAKALEVGASHVLDPKECDALAEVRRLTGGLGADVSFECIGNKHTAKLAIDLIRKAGKCVLVGIFEEPSEFNFFELVATEKQVLGALAYNGEFADVIAFIADGRLDITPLVTGRISWSRSWGRASRNWSTTRSTTSKSSCRPLESEAAESHDGPGWSQADKGYDAEYLRRYCDQRNIIEHRFGGLKENRTLDLRPVRPKPG
jgi:hypothetical protein